MKTISWFSGGCTSAIACHIALKKYDNVELVYIETGSHHPDHERFIKDCQQWYDRKIKVIRSNKFNDIFEVFEKLRFIKSPLGAPCTKHLKMNVRKIMQKDNPDITHQVWGFEDEPKEHIRAERIKETNTSYINLFPLIDEGITKQQAINTLIQVGIELPAMYKLGYNNSNCIGCVKGGMSYWNKIRIDFPDVFERMAKFERKLGRHALKECFLDELDPNRGKDKKPLVLDCGSTGEGCELQLYREYISI